LFYVSPNSYIAFLASHHYWELFDVSYVMK